MAVSAPAVADMSLALALRQLRHKRGYTQEDLAYRAGLTVAALARIERGQANPTWTTVRRIADALDMGVQALGRAVERADAERRDP